MRSMYDRPMAQVPAVVYRHFSPDGALLYIGSTTLLPEREANHRLMSPWMVDGVTTEAVACGSLRVAREAEAEAIRAEFPRWNILYRSKDHPDGCFRRYWDVAQMYPGTYHPSRVPEPWREFQRRRAILRDGVQQKLSAMGVSA